MNSTPLPKLILNKKDKTTTVDTNFKFATNGSPSNYQTKVVLEHTETALITHFECHNDPFVDQNHMRQHNDPLYNQEVFEIFISAGPDDPKRYLEVEINPNGAVWIGYIDNPDLGEKTQTLDYQLLPDQANIRFESIKGVNIWSGFISIPWSLISENRADTYRINFYRIRRRSQPKNQNWICNDRNCDFICWSPTLSGQNAAFHRPKKFGFLHIE